MTRIYTDEETASGCFDSEAENKKETASGCFDSEAENKKETASGCFDSEAENIYICHKSVGLA